MKLLFDKGGQGSAEIKDILGFTDADIKFKNLKPYVITATDEIIKIIGTTIYNSLVAIYESETPSDEAKEFLNRAQYAILLDAARFYFIDVDLGYTPNGRVNRVEQNQKIAFEWQIERSNRQAERKYYKAVNALINYLDANVSGWKSTDAYKATHDLFVRTTDQFDYYFNIDGSRLLMFKLSPGIRKAENENILPRIGKEKFDDLKSKLKNNTGDHDTKLLSLIQEAVVYASLAWGVERLSAQLFPEGVLVVTDTSRLTTAARKATEKNEVAALAQRFKQDADAAYAKIESYIEESNQVPYTPPASILPKRNESDTFVDC